MIRLGNTIRAARRWLTLHNPYRMQQMYKNVFESPEGQLVLEHMCRNNFVFRTTYVRGGDDRRMAFNEGKRHTALSVLRYINKSPDEFLKLIEDGMERDEAANKVSSAS